MPKTLTAGMESHLQEEVTTLATLWRITRTDGVEFFFTDHDSDIEYDGEVYGAESSYQRTAIQNDVTMAVDNLDIEGIFDSELITEEDLRAGKFDYAQVRIYVVNWSNLTDGDIKMRNGRMGEVTLTEQGVFKAELRGLTQALGQNLGELYQPECRADLGDSRCKFPIAPAVRANDTSYSVGDIIRVATNGTGDLTPAIVLLVPGDSDEDDKSRYAAAGTLGAEAAVSATQSKFGSSSIEFAPTATVDPSTSSLTFASDAKYKLAGLGFTVELWVRFKSLAASVQTLASDSNSASNQRGWYLRRSGVALEFSASSGGTTMNLVNLSGSVLWVADTWYHVAITRRGDVWRLFLDGEIVSQATAAGSIFTTTAPVVLGKYRNVGVSDLPLNGFIDDFRMYVGDALYVNNFDVPTAAHPLAPATAQQSAYENVMYECITAGVSDSSVPTYDTTLDADTTDGTAEFTAYEAFTRHAWVDTVTDSSTFTLSPVGFTPVMSTPDDIYNGGALVFEDGDNEGKAIEIKDWVASTRTVTLFLPAPYRISPGTALRLYPGCDKRSTTCKAKFLFGEHLFANGNIKNFRGEPFIPGADSLTEYPDAK
jgi:hypothetical protein